MPKSVLTGTVKTRHEEFKQIQTRPDSRLTDKEKKIFEMVMDRMNWSERWREPWIEQRIEEYELYRQKLDEELRKQDKRSTKREVSENRLSRLPTPHLYSQVEHYTAKMKGATIPPNSIENVVRLMPNNYRQSEEVDHYEKFMNYQFYRAGIRSGKGTEWLRNFTMFGPSPVQVYWRMEWKDAMYREKRTFRDPATGAEMVLGYGPLQRQRVKSYDGMDFYNIDAEDFYPSPNSLDFGFGKMPWCAIKKFIPYDALVAQAQLGRFREDLVKDVSTIDESTDSGLPASIQNITVMDDNFNRGLKQHLKNSGVVEIIEYWTKDMVVTVANKKVPIRIAPNPYYFGEIPIICPTRQKITGDPWGIGLLETLGPLQRYVTAITNLRLDSINYVINKVFKAIKGEVPQDAMNLYPGKTIWLDDMDSLQEMEFNDVLPSAYTEINELVSMMDITTGLGPGATRNAPNIRSGIQQIAFAELTGERTQLDIDSFCNNGIVPLAKFTHMLNQQFLLEDQTFPVMGEDRIAKWLTLPLDHVFNDYEFFATGAAKSVPKAVEAQQKFQLVGGLVGILQQFPDLLTNLYKQIALDSNQPELAKTLDTIQKIVQGVREESGGTIQPQNQGGAPSQQGRFGQMGADTSANNSTNIERFINAVDNT